MYTARGSSLIARANVSTQIRHAATATEGVIFLFKERSPADSRSMSAPVGHFTFYSVHTNELVVPDYSPTSNLNTSKRCN